MSIFEQYINRNTEKQNLLDDISSFNNGNRVVIIHAPSGVGKSAFCHQIMHMSKSIIVGLKITIPYGRNIELGQGLYLKTIATEIDRNAKIFNYLSFNAFLRKLKSKDLKKIYNLKLIEDLQPLGKFIKPISTVFSRLNNTGCFNAELYLYEDNENLLYTIIKGYIRFVLQQQNILLNIENIQSIDTNSLTILKELLDENGIYFLLEYTLDDNNINEVYKFSDNFKHRNCKIDVIKLEKLGFDDFCTIMHNIPNIDRTKLHDYYLNIDGNLRQIVDIESIISLSCSQHSIDCSESITNYTAEHLKYINRHQMQILCLVVVHNCKVKASVLSEMLMLKQYELFILIEKELCELSSIHKLLYNHDGHIELVHDSIYHLVINNQDFFITLTTAYSLWISYYEKILSSKKYYVEDFDTIILLTHFYTNFEYSYKKVLDLLPHIRELACRSSNPTMIIDYLLKFDEKIRKINNVTLSKKINYFILRLCYDLGLFEMAYNQLSNIDLNGYNTDIYYAMLNDRLMNYEESLVIIQTCLAKNPDNRTKLYLLLIKMISCASLNRYNDCVEIFNEICYNEIYKDIKEYGFFLRNSEIVLSLEESIKFLEESIKFFNPIDKICAEQARISLSMNQARLGLLDKARLNLSIAKETLYNLTLEKHIILNNMAAIEMCDGKFNDSIIEYLRLAGFYAFSIFDKLIVHKNLLIVLKKINQYLQGEIVVEYLMKQIEKEKNKLNICYTYWNISYFYKGYDTTKYEYYYNHYTLLLAELQEHGLRIDESYQSGCTYMPNMEYVIEFISYWHFPLPEEN